MLYIVLFEYPVYRLNCLLLTLDQVSRSSKTKALFVTYIYMGVDVWNLFVYDIMENIQHTLQEST